MIRRSYGKKRALDTMINVVCVGIAVVDFVFVLDEMPMGIGKHHAHEFHEVGGGVAANGAATVVALGGSACLASRVGPGPIGQSVIDGFAACGVDVSPMMVAEGARTSISAVMIDAAGERMIVNDTDPRLFIGDEGVPFDAIATASAVLVDTRWHAGAVSALVMAKRHGIPGLIDFDRGPEPGFEDLLSNASHILFGQEGLIELSGKDDPGAGLEAVAGMTNAWLGVTLGEDGVCWREGAQLRSMPAFRVEVVDTLAAGDVFHGAFALALAEKQSIEEALRFSSAAAAIKCTRFGGRDGIPNRADVEQFLSERA